MTYEELMRDVHRNKLPAWYHLYPDVPKITVLLGDFDILPGMNAGDSD